MTDAKNIGLTFFKQRSSAGGFGLFRPVIDEGVGWRKKGNNPPIFFSDPAERGG